MKMHLEEFDYYLPKRLIAQRPCKKRDASRLMVLDKGSGQVRPAFFYELPSFLKKGDLLVINDSKVIPARLFGTKAKAGQEAARPGAAIEVLLLRKIGYHGTDRWQALLRPGKRVHPGVIISFGPDGEAEVAGKISEKLWILDFRTLDDFDSFLLKRGHAPVPPYIKRKPEDGPEMDLERYQTVYARNPGSVAAPTAGLHFSEAVLTSLLERGVGIATLTLHVGYGTFMPIETDSIEHHVMEEEFYEVPRETVDAVSRAHRVIAVGTTSARALESATDENGILAAGMNSTRLFIYPGFRFKIVQGLVTNFHLPKSSLLLLAAAFAGRENILNAYSKAVEESYHFYSYGDCMLIL